jgi:hypothetical protein
MQQLLGSCHGAVRHVGSPSHYVCHCGRRRLITHYDRLVTPYEVLVRIPRFANKLRTVWTQITFDHE